MFGNPKYLRKRRIYFLELNCINISLVLFFRFIGISIYFLTASKFWQKNSRLIKLNELGIIWLNYQNIGKKMPAIYFNRG